MNIPENYRRLTNQEIDRLRQQGCTAEDWSLIEIAPDTDLRQMEHVHFSGTNRIGAFRKVFTFPGGMTRRAGIRHAALHDTTVGDDCLIEHIQWATTASSNISMTTSRTTTSGRNASSCTPMCWP